MSTEEKKRFMHIMQGLGESSTLHGVPKIVTSRHIVVKILWCALLIGAVALFTWQMLGLFREYFSYPTKTTVTLNFAHLSFPALTFCNLNPIKQSFAASWGQYSYISKLLSDLEWGDIYDEYGDTFSKPTLQWYNNYMSGYREYNDSRDEYEAWNARLMTEIKKLEEEDRLKAGHQLIDFVYRATFAGKHLPLKLFKTRSTSKFGNCFTLDNNAITAHGSGHAHSLHLVFNVDAFEYLHDFSSSYGVRMVLHEQGTYPLPDAEGITLSTNYETNIGIRMNRISRLGGKYGECSDGDSFSKRYGIKYTVPICYSICEAETILKLCNCIPISSEIDSQPSARICAFDNTTEWNCVDKVFNSIKNGSVICDCPNRCTQNVYSTTLSGGNWPHSTYLENVLVEETCSRLNDTSENFTIAPEFIAICNKSDNISNQKVAENFLSVYIYYEDLNYETLSEQPLYNLQRFLSDIGGALGLYMGASCLTCVELLQVILEIILHLRKKCRNVSPQNSSSEEIIE